MALIRKLEEGASNIQPHRSQVDATYQMLTNAKGEPLLHLATYGSDNRKSEPKVSQTIQLDKTTALELMAIIKSAFS